MTKKCEQCDAEFQPVPSAPHQKYCGRSCRLARKREWQKEKLENDATYRENQAAAQAAWRERHPDYMWNYRRRVPRYAERNRLQQRTRNSRRKGAGGVAPGPRIGPDETGMIVRMDSLRLDPKGLSGRFWLVPAKAGVIVNMDSLLVDLQPVQAPVAQGGP